jgi:4-hydroxy-3-methylbut-2-enyl diphosphate reductase
MKIIIAKTSGFCMGVRRAVEMVLDAPEKNENPICTYGPLIHNPQVLDVLESKDISALNDIPENGSGTILIRAHGVPPQTKAKLKDSGFKVLDATCPRVIKVQTIIRKHAKKNYASIIIGDKNHPEVTGLLGYAGEKGYVVGSLEELEALPAFENAIIVAQTTQNTQLFEAVKSWTAKKHPNYKIFETICGSTELRQAEVKRLAESVDVVIVVGGRESGNTKRLVEIAQQTGKPAYHIETDKDVGTINYHDLSSAQRIGIAAGASTPNWIIKKVYKALESLLIKRQRGWRRALYRMQRFLLLTNIYVSLGAGFLSYACSKLLGIGQYFPYIIISILYIQSMHIFNHLIGSQSDQFNDPERARFYLTYKWLLSILAIVSGAAGLIIAYTLGIIPFLILLVMSLMGLSYNLPLFPKGFTYIKYRRIRDIPGSKTLLIALAWGVVTAVLPPLSVEKQFSWISGLIFLWSVGIVFVRTAFFDILDMQGDRIVGKETIPILLGEKHSIRLLKIVLVVLVAILLLSAGLQLISRLGFLLILCPAFLYIILSVYENRWMLPSIKMEFLIESTFVMTGILSFFWTLLSLQV